MLHQDKSELQIFVEVRSYKIHNFRYIGEVLRTGDHSKEDHKGSVVNTISSPYHIAVLLVKKIYLGSSEPWEQLGISRSKWVAGG